MVRSRWLKFPQHYANVEFDAWIIMPNHVYGILILTTPSAEPGVTFGRELVDHSANHLPHAAPLPPRLGAGAVGSIVLNFKSVTTRSFNRIWRSPGSSIWQRNYYERIIRNEREMDAIWLYIEANPVNWGEDEDNPQNVRA